jgi:DNA-binding NarL/FixJ family response regulator
MMTRAFAPAWPRSSAARRPCASGGDYPDAETALKEIPIAAGRGADGHQPARHEGRGMRPPIEDHPARNVQFLMLTVYEDSDSLFNSLKAGASGYLLKRTASARLLEAIHDVHAGGSPMTPATGPPGGAVFFQAGRGDSSPLARLAPGEKEFLDQLAKGYAYKEIADRMNISIDTVRSYVRTVYEKLHVHSRTEAVVKYLRGSQGWSGRDQVRPLHRPPHLFAIPIRKSVLLSVAHGPVHGNTADAVIPPLLMLSRT